METGCCALTNHSDAIAPPTMIDISIFRIADDMFHLSTGLEWNRRPLFVALNLLGWPRNRQVLPAKHKPVAAAALGRHLDYHLPLHRYARYSRRPCSHATPGLFVIAAIEASRNRAA